MQKFGFALLSLPLAALVLSCPASAKEPPKSEVSFRVCVAGISNRTATSLFEERMQGRLAKGLGQNKLAAVTLDSLTTDDSALHPTVANGSEMKSHECDYLLLTQVRDPKRDLTTPRVPPISIGGRVPSTDASDPLGGESVYRDNLEVDFALFRAGKFEAETDASIQAQPSTNVSDSLMQAMDRVANRVAHDLKKIKK